MTKRFITSLIILLLAGNLIGQKKGFPLSYIGVYTGINYSGFIGDYNSNISGESGKYRLRTQFGIYGNYFLKENYSIYSAFELVLHGAFTKGEETIDGVDVAYTAKTSISSFSLPVLFNYTPQRDLGFMVGPQASYIISALEPWHKSDFYKPEGYNENVINKFRRFTVDGVVAINYLLMQGVTFQLRYTIGLIPLVKEEYGNARSSSIMFYVGLNFPKYR